MIGVLECTHRVLAEHDVRLAVELFVTIQTRSAADSGQAPYEAAVIELLGLEEIATARAMSRILDRILRDAGGGDLLALLGETLSTYRATEVVSDATNLLALECAVRRKKDPTARRSRSAPDSA